MPKATTVDLSGARTGERELPEAIFGLRPHRALIHQALVIEQANGRAGTHATRTRGDVRGGGRKPWRQKGTGRARHGSRRSPLWVGGGITFGPHPRSHAQKQSRKERALALRSALSAQALAGRVVLVELSAAGKRPSEGPSTKAVASLLASLGGGSGAVVVTGADDAALARAAANIRGTRVLSARRLVLRDLLVPRPVVVTTSALTALEEVLGR
ncbi:MAG: 50S ribosomal protein L4 [bacterium]